MSFNSATTPAAVSGQTIQGLLVDATSGTAFAAEVTSSPTTSGTTISYGFTGPAQTIADAQCEVQQYGAGALNLDPSSPASVSSSAAATATTAAFTPPPGSLILALAAANGNATTDEVGVTSSVPLNWVLLTEYGASNGATYAVTAIYAAIMPPPPIITTTGLPGGMVGNAYSATMRATTGTPAYTWAKTSGSLPTGLSLNSSTGVISGTPSAAGTYNFTIQVTDATSQTALVAFTGSIVINAGSTPGGVTPATWALAAEEYSYGTLAVPVSTNEHDWLFVSVSWAGTEEEGIAYCSDNAHNFYEPGPLASSAAVCTQVFVVPNARAASEIYVSTSAYARWLNVQVTDVSGLQPGYVVDTSFPYAGGAFTSITDTINYSTADFILAVAALTGSPQTITQSGTGPTWTALTGSFNGNASSGVTQSIAWAETTGSGTATMQFTGLSGNWSSVVIAVYTQGGLPPVAGTSIILDEGSGDLLDEAGGPIYDERGPLSLTSIPNPAWPVISCQAAFGYQPQQPTVLPTWTDITGRFLGINGQRGRSFELDEISAANMTLALDNRDGALSPQNTASPYYPNVTLITPVRLIATWQGRTYYLFRGLMTAIPQTYDFQRGLVKVACSDDFSKLAVTLLATCMIQEQMYDNPLDLWPLNDQQGAPYASNWSGRSAATLVPTVSQLGPGGIPKSQLVLGIAGKTIPVNSTLVSSKDASIAANSGNNSNLPATGFGNANSGIWPGGLAGTSDTVWGNTSNVLLLGVKSANQNEFQATVLMDSNDSTLPMTATGATYSVWVNMTNTSLNALSFANILTLTNQAGSTSKNFLTIGLQDTTIVLSQTAAGGSIGTFSPGYDGNWHLWTVTISTGGSINVYIDAVHIFTYSGIFPSGSPTMLQWGGDTTQTPNFNAGLFTGYMMNASVYDYVVDLERIQAWYLSGSTGFLNEDTGTRIERILSWARWSGPQAIDQGVHLQQQLNYLTGGYASAGVTGSVGNYATAGGSIAVDTGAQADMTIQDIANTECGLVAMMADGCLTFRNVNNLGIAQLGLALGDMDYPLNSTVTFEDGLGEWVNTTSCTVVQSDAWSYDQAHSALMTVTGTPSQADVLGGEWPVSAGEEVGFSCWVMSPQGCFVAASINWYGNTFADTYQANYTDLFGIPTFGFLSNSSGPSYWCPPMTPVFIQMSPAAAPANTLDAQPAISIGSPAAGTQLYFDHTRMSPAGFQVPYLNDSPGDLEVTEDIQYLFNDIAVTRNADQVGVRVRDATSRTRYYPRVYTRTIFASADDPTALTDAANTLLAAFKSPALRVEKVMVDAACNPEAWPFVLSADVGDTVSFTRAPIGGAEVTGSFIILSINVEFAPDKAKFSYVLSPSGVF